MSKWRAVWILIFIVGGAVEFAALANDAPDDTLSEQVWALLVLYPALDAVIAAALVWLIVHFIRRPK